MTTQEFNEIAGYLTNPSRQVHIELEILNSKLSKYITSYQNDSGLIFPAIPNDFVYIVKPGGNKWGREMRIYLNCTDKISTPPELASISTVGGRPGYDIYNRRVNNIALIDKLILIGFVLGSPQDELRIRSKIDPAFILDFNNGYNLA